MHEHEGHTYPKWYNLDLPPVEAIKAQQPHVTITYPMSSR